MISVILATILGILFTFLATQNPGLIIVNFFGNSFSIPIYLFAVLCFLIGAGIAMIFNLFDLIVVSHDRDARLQTQINNLQSENAKLQSELRGEKFNRTKNNIKSFFNRRGHIVN